MLSLKCVLKAGKFRLEEGPEELGEGTPSATFSGNFGVSGKQILSKAVNMLKCCLLILE